MNTKRTISINEMLSFVNVIVFVLIIYVSIREAGIETNPYIDGLSLLLGLLLCFQTQVLLRIEKNNTDPFILVLAYVTTLYYSLRLVSLAMYPSSLVFDRGFYGPENSNFALVVILAANTCLAAGLFSIKLKLGSVAIDISKDRPAQPKLATGVLFAVIAVAGLRTQLSGEGIIWRLIDLALAFLNSGIIFLVVGTYILLFRAHIHLFFRLAIVVAALCLVILQTFGGSRSGLLTYIHYGLFLILAIVPLFRIKLRTFMFAAALSPIIYLIFYSIFIYATLSRFELQETGQNLSISEKYRIIGESRKLSMEATPDEIEALTDQALGRIGFFDFTAEIIAHREMYSELFSPQSYVKSIVDNVLTPGFDIFDYPRIANGLVQVYNGYGYPTKSGILTGYKSDQISLIGEMFAVFGYVSFAMFFLLGRIFKYIYAALGKTTAFGLAVKRVFLIVIFHKLLLSFGFDWLLLDLIIIAVTVAGTKLLFDCRRKPIHLTPHPNSG